MIDRIRGAGSPGTPSRAGVPRPGAASAFDGMVGPPQIQVPVSGATSIGSLLAMQDDGGAAAAAADDAARQHGETMLAAMAGLQRDALADQVRLDGLSRLAELVERAPAAADPRLRALVAAVGVRARVELARYSRTSGANLA